MEVLDRHGLRATVALNSEVCAHHPQIIAQGAKRRWEWMGHCESNARRLNEAPPGEGGDSPSDAGDDREGERRAAGRLVAESGLQETWDTLDILAAEGCEYVCDWTNDDEPSPP